MSHSGIPAASDVEAQLTAAGQTIGTVSTANIIAATVADWERMTGWHPFLAAGEDVTRYYDWPRDGMLLLPGFAVLTSIATGVTYNQTTGAVIAGTAAVENVDYRPIYWRMDDTTTPVVAVEFTRRLSFGYYSRYRSIAVTGKVGYMVTVPDDAWQAIVDGAAARAYTSTNMAQTKGISKMVIGGRTIEFNGSQAVTWRDSFTRTASQYKRAGVV